ncbi:DUF2183 domain-containing protein [bacterium]|nr:DUF2183 domain-containing protein [bacterium]
MAAFLVDNERNKEVFLVPEQGLSVISDIDDTVKVSNVLDSHRMLQATFLEEFQVVSGMPQLFQCLHARGTTFHYVSGSPWQLYQPLLDFFQSSGLPAGSVQLKHFTNQI